MHLSGANERKQLVLVCGMKNELQLPPLQVRKHSIPEVAQRLEELLHDVRLNGVEDACTFTQLDQNAEHVQHLRE